MRCGRPLTRDDVGAHRKFVDRGAEHFLCVECLAAHFRCDPALLRQKIEDLRKAGCTLFR